MQQMYSTILENRGGRIEIRKIVVFHENFLTTRILEIIFFFTCTSQLKVIVYVHFRNKSCNELKI